MLDRHREPPHRSIGRGRIRRQPRLGVEATLIFRLMQARKADACKYSRVTSGQSAVWSRERCVWRVLRAWQSMIEMAELHCGKVDADLMQIFPQTGLMRMHSTSFRCSRFWDLSCSVVRSQISRGKEASWPRIVLQGPAGNSCNAVQEMLPRQATRPCHLACRRRGIDLSLCVFGSEHKSAITASCASHAE